MDFRQNNAGLDQLLERFKAFTGGNPTGIFKSIHTPIDKYQQSPILTKEALGDAALDTMAGVMVETPSGGAVTLFTGNSPGARERAGFLADMLTNFQTFYSWMKAYLDIRQNGFTITYRPDFDDSGTPLNTGSFLAIGPGFLSLGESPYAVAESAEGALSALLAEMERRGAEAEAGAQA